jgi:phenylacetaldehyde dehydrogenase
MIMATSTDLQLPGYVLTQPTRDFLKRVGKMLIGSEWVWAASGKTLDSFDPATGRVIARVAAADKADVDRAVLAARSAVDTSAWSSTLPAERERLLLKLADLIEARTEELAEIESLDNGKPLAVARMIDVGKAPAFVRYMAGWATKIEGSTIAPSVNLGPKARLTAYTLKEPVGVVGAIIPWNFPLAMALWKICPALATGSTVVLKPAEQTPLSALRLGELVLQAGFPPGVVNIVTGFGESAGAALAGHPGINKIAFTGSTEVGKLIARAAAENVTRMSLELGGKSPVIVLPDANIEMAVQGAARGIFFNAGQVCAAGSRLYVHKKIYPEVLAGVAAVAKGMKLGPGLMADTQMGPLVSEEQRKRVMAYIQAGIGEGAQLLSGGESVAGGGYFVTPTVLGETRAAMTVVREEIFGPVLAASSFEDLDEVIAQANDSEFGLAASVWSNDLSAVHRIIPRLKAGTVYVNAPNLVDPAVPFGGYKHSGFGREMAKAAIDMYTETKSVIVAY